MPHEAIPGIRATKLSSGTNSMWMTREIRLPGKRIAAAIMLQSRDSLAGPKKQASKSSCRFRYLLRPRLWSNWIARLISASGPSDLAIWATEPRIATNGWETSHRTADKDKSLPDRI